MVYRKPSFSLGNLFVALVFLGGGFVLFFVLFFKAALRKPRKFYNSSFINLTLISNDFINFFTNTILTIREKYS